MGQDGDGHAHFDQIWRPNITINYIGVDQNIKFNILYLNISWLPSSIIVATRTSNISK
jgi:hypothetical protein